MATFQFFFQSRQQVVVRRGPILRIGWVIKTLEAQLGQFLLSCKCLVSRAFSCKNKTPLVTFTQRFSFKMSFNCTSRDANSKQELKIPTADFMLTSLRSLSYDRSIASYKACSSSSFNFKYLLLKAVQ